MPPTNFPLTPKQLRIIERERRQLFRAKSFIAPRPGNDGDKSTFLSRRLTLSDGRSFLLTDLALEQFRRIVKTLHDANMSKGQASYSDLWSACRKVLINSMATEDAPDNAVTFIQLAMNALESEIDTRYHIVPLYGTELQGIDELQLGTFRIVRPSVAFIDSSGVQYKGDHLEKAVEAMRHYLWIYGAARGTPKVAANKFQLHARLLAGLLAVIAAASYEHGATGFRIGIITAPEEGHGRSIALSWDEKTRSLSSNYQFVRAQPLTLDAQFLEWMQDFDIDGAIKALESETRTELEDALVRAVYWYSDAHRDTVPVMQLVKYWSCIETFFSADKEQIVQSVTRGLATILVYGGYHWIPVDEYRQLKKKITRLYALRSQAVHRASHDHVTRADTGQLSQWAAWMILTLFRITQGGCTELSQLKAESERLDALHKTADATEPTSSD